MTPSALAHGLVRATAHRVEVLSVETRIVRQPARTRTTWAMSRRSRLVAARFASAAVAPTAASTMAASINAVARRRTCPITDGHARRSRRRDAHRHTVRLELVEEPHARGAATGVVGQRARDPVCRLDDAVDLAPADGGASPGAVRRAAHPCADARSASPVRGELRD